jgi:hypothetical protein
MSLFRLTLFMLDHDNETRQCALIVQATDGDPTAAFPPILPAGVETDSVAQEVLTPAEARARFEIALRKHYPAFDPARAADNELTRTVRNQGRAIERIKGAVARLAELVAASVEGRARASYTPPPDDGAGVTPIRLVPIGEGTRLREVVVGGQRVKVVEKLELDTAETVDERPMAGKVFQPPPDAIAKFHAAMAEMGKGMSTADFNEWAARIAAATALPAPTALPIAPDEVDWGKIAREAPVGHRFDPPVPIDFSTAPPAPDRYAKLEDRAGERGLENIRSTSMNVGTNRSEIEKFGPDGKLVKEPLPRFGESLPARSDIK